MRFELGSLILHGTRPVTLFDPGAGGLKVRAVARLVSERPGHDRRMVFVALDHAPGAVEVGRLPLGFGRQGAAGIITDPVALKVGFVHHIEAVKVAQVIPFGRVRIVGRAHRIEVVLLHQANVLDHRLARDRVAGVRVHFVPVDSLDVDGPPIKLEARSLDLDPPEPDRGRNDLQHPILFILEREEEPIQEGRFGRPRNDSAYGQVGDEPFWHRRDGASAKHSLGIDVSARGRQTHLHAGCGHGGRAQIGDLGLDVQQTVGQGIVQASHEEQVPHLNQAQGGEIDVAEDAAQTPLVLVFEIRAIGIAINFHRQQIVALFEKRREIELGGGAAVLAEADTAAVAPDIKRGLHPLEMHPHLPVPPGCGNLKRLAIGTDRVAVVRDARWVHLAPRAFVIGPHAVDVNGIVVALQLPAGRHGDGLPCMIIELDSVELLRSDQHIRGPPELPRAVQRLIPRRSRASFGQRFPQVGVPRG